MFTIQLTTPQKHCRIGEGPKINISVQNHADHPIRMVGVLDGSEAGLRYPHYWPEIRLNGILFSQPLRVEDPLVGPLRPSDFHLLGPGQTFDPTAASPEHAYQPIITFVNFIPNQPGTYEFRLSLSTMSDSPEEWLGIFGQDAYRAEVLENVLRVPRVKIESNFLEIIVD